MSFLKTAVFFMLLFTLVYGGLYAKSGSYEWAYGDFIAFNKQLWIVEAAIYIFLWAWRYGWDLIINR